MTRLRRSLVPPRCNARAAFITITGGYRECADCHARAGGYPGMLPLTGDYPTERCDRPVDGLGARRLERKP